MVRVDRHLRIHKSRIREKLSKFSQLPFCQKLIFLNQTPSCICSMCLHCLGKVSNSSIKSCGRSWSAHEDTIYAYTSMCLHCIGKVSNCSIKSCGRSWSAHEGTIYAYTKALLGKNFLSSQSWHFVKKYSFFNQTPSCIRSMCLYCIGKVSNCSIKSCGRSWSANEGTIYAYTKAFLGENCLSSQSWHFVTNNFLQSTLLHAWGSRGGRMISE